MIRDLVSGFFSVLFKTDRIRHSPLNLQIEPTTHCNLNCRMCIRRDVVKQPSHMDESVFHTAIKKLNPHRVVFAGSGEPLLHPQMPDMIRALKSRRIRTMISTNLMVGTERLDSMLDAGVDVIKISIDAADEATYLRIRENGDFRRLLGNIRFLSRGGKPGPDLRFEYVLMKENIEGLPALIDLAADHGIRRAYFRELQTFGMAEPRREGLLTGFDFDRLRAALAGAAVRAKSRGVRTNVKELLAHLGAIRELYSMRLSSAFSARCLLPWLSAFVSVNGDVAPCCALLINAGVRTGNVMENSRDELLNGPAMVCIRRAFRTGRVSPVCRDCLPRDLPRLFTMIKSLPRYF